MHCIYLRRARSEIRKRWQRPFQYYNILYYTILHTIYYTLYTIRYTIYYILRLYIGACGGSVAQDGGGGNGPISPSVSFPLPDSLSFPLPPYVCIYVYMSCVCIYIYIYIYMYTLPLYKYTYYIYIYMQSPSPSLSLLADDLRLSDHAAVLAALVLAGSGFVLSLHVFVHSEVCLVTLLRGPLLREESMNIYIYVYSV